MKAALVPFFCLLSIWMGVQAQGSGYYNSRYDYLDIEAILDNRRLVKNYVDCLLNEKPCSPEGKALKRILPEALRTKCAKCSPRQKHAALAILRRLKGEHNNEWSRLASRWDPTGDLTKRFEDFLDKDDINQIDSKPAQPPPAQPPPALPLKPVVVTRFGDEEQAAPSETRPTIRSVSSSTSSRSTTRNPVVQTTIRPKPRPKPTNTKRPEFSYQNTLPTPIKVDLTPIYEGTMGLIDHFGNKIIKTTELVTDLLKNTVRVVAGG